MVSRGLFSKKKNNTRASQICVSKQTTPVSYPKMQYFLANLNTPSMTSSGSVASEDLRPFNNKKTCEGVNSFDTLG